LAELLVIFDYCVRRLTRTLWDKESNKPRIRVDLKNIERNLSQSLESMAAEPFYVLSALSGDEDAHERARLAVQKSISEGSSFLVALTSDPELKLNFEKIPKNKRKFVENPLLYTGIAARKTMQVAKHWERALRDLTMGN
jgi:hypothetical protein